MSATNPRFQVQQPAGPNMRIVWDSWLGTEAARFHQGAGEHAETAQLLAETRAAELNLPSADPLGFVAKLSTWMSETINEGTHPREVIEDMDKIMDHYLGQMRGVRVEDLDESKLYSPAPWVNRHGLGA